MEKGERSGITIDSYCDKSLCRFNSDRRLKGALTVEAAMIIPMVLFFFGATMKIGIEMYKDVADTAEVTEKTEEAGLIGIFYAAGFLESEEE